MNISDLIRIRNQLVIQKSMLDLSSYVNTARVTLTGFAIGTEYNNKTKDLAKTYDIVDDLAISVSDKFNQLIDDINHDIDALADKLAGSDYESKFRQMIRLVDDVSLEDTRSIPEEVSNRISHYINWRLPTLILGCRNSDLINKTISGDPIYFADCDHRFIKNIKNKFNDSTQKKIRDYVLTQYNSLPHFANHTGHISDYRFLDKINDLLDFSQLPNNQMAFIFSWNFFNFVTLDTMEIYLKNILDLMRPGGVFMFEYNNCDNEAAIYEFEKGVKTWIPQRRLTELAERVGLEIIEYHDFDQCSYAIMRKPGKLKTSKMSMSIGRKIFKHS